MENIRDGPSKILKRGSSSEHVGQNASWNVLTNPRGVFPPKPIMRGNSHKGGNNNF